MLKKCSWLDDRSNLSSVLLTIRNDAEDIHYCFDINCTVRCLRFVCPVPVTDEAVIIMLAAIDSVVVCGLKSDRS